MLHDVTPNFQKKVLKGKEIWVWRCDSLPWEGVGGRGLVAMLSVETPPCPFTGSRTPPEGGNKIVS